MEGRLRGCTDLCRQWSTRSAAPWRTPGFTFYKEDIRSREGIFSIFEKERPDVVVNFAAESHVDRSIENPGIFLETNILGTQVMLDAAANTACSASIRSAPTRSTATCRSTAPSLSSGRTRRSTRQPLQHLQGLGRPADHGVLPHLRPARHGLPLLEQLRPLSVPRKAHSSDDQQRPGTIRPLPSTARV